MNLAKFHKKVGILLLIDFEKAYDSLSFSYIKKCLMFFNFGNSIINWIGLLLHNFSAVLNHCGNISKRFNISRGARQGDPIASYLFIICIEILAHKLRHGTTEGFKVNGNSKTIELYADDCSIFLEPSESNLRNTLAILQEFYLISGLRISVSKTKAIWFGDNCRNKMPLCHDLALDWDIKFKLLGVTFYNDLVGMECNYTDKLEEIRKLLNCWTNRIMTVYGKITIIKSLALSKLSHLAIVLPNLNVQKVKELETLFFKFIWNGKPDKVARDHMKLCEKAGGLGMVDVKMFWLSLKFSWLRRALNTNSFWLDILESEVAEVLGQKISICSILHFGPIEISNIGKKINNCFWNQVFQAVNHFMLGALFCYPEMLLFSPIWDNPMITRNEKPLKRSNFRSLSEKMQMIYDFYDPISGEMLSVLKIREQFQVEISDELYLVVKYLIRCTKRKLGINEDLLTPFSRPVQPLLIRILRMVTKGCSI